MKVRIGDETRTGRVVDIGDADVPPDAVARAVRGDDPEGVSVSCPAPGPAHEHVGAIRPGMALSVRPALAAAARSRGRTAPQDDELAAVRERLNALDPPGIDLADARRRVAEASGAEAELRERVASLRGRVRALREAGADPSDAEADLSDATRRLAEVETERIAAEQALARARERARTSRAERRERLRLRDRADNLRRAAREHLAEAVRDAFDDALDAVPGPVATETDPVAAALAVARVADLDAPVVLAERSDRFPSADRASRWLDAPVVRV